MVRPGACRGVPRDFVWCLIGGKAAQPSRQSSAMTGKSAVTLTALVGSCWPTWLYGSARRLRQGRRTARSAARPTGAAKRMPGVPGWKVFAVRAERAASGGLDPVEPNSAARCARLPTLSERIRPVSLALLVAWLALTVREQAYG
jgi:hypothetical protein